MRISTKSSEKVWKIRNQKAAYETGRGAITAGVNKKCAYRLYSADRSCVIVWVDSWKWKVESKGVPTGQLNHYVSKTRHSLVNVSWSRFVGLFWIIPKGYHNFQLSTFNFQLQLQFAVLLTKTDKHNKKYSASDITVLCAWVLAAFLYNRARR